MTNPALIAACRIPQTALRVASPSPMLVAERALGAGTRDAQREGHGNSNDDDSACFDRFALGAGAPWPSPSCWWRRS